MLIFISEAKNELAKEIAESEHDAESALELSIDDTKTPVGVVEAEEIFIEQETAEEKMRSSYWGLELLYKTGSIDPATPVYAFWLGIVSLAFCYNACGILLREAFPRYSTGSALLYWLLLDYFCDSIYLIDIFVKTRLMFHDDDGLVVFERTATTKRYLKTTGFRLDLLALFPLDILYLIPQVGIRPILRVFRLTKIRSFWEFFDRVSSLLDSPDVLRILKILFYILFVVHIYTCAFYVFSVHVSGVGNGIFSFEGEIKYPHVYARCFYVGFRIATSINSDKPLDGTKATTSERGFMIFLWLVATFVVVVLLAQIRETFFGWFCL